VVRFARDSLQIRLMRWQRDALALALQRRAGRRLFRDCTITVPRQSGKSTMVLVLAVWLMTSKPGSRVVYAAQARVSARQKLLRGWWPVVRDSPLGEQFSIFRANGSEALRCDNGSELVLLSQEERTGHGETADAIFLDECWSYPDERVEQAARPMLATKASGQLFALSTAGNARSTWWWNRLDAARLCAQMGMPDGHCLIEYSAPDDADLFDEQVWAACMPALGETITVDTVRADLAGMGPEQFSRAYLNRRPTVDDTGWRIIPKDVWEAARDD
jgi:phage terminase large subunit-like protein